MSEAVGLILSSVQLHNGLLALLFICALVNLGFSIYQVVRCENCHRIHADMLSSRTGSFPAIGPESSTAPEPGLYFPQEADEARAINERAVADAQARSNPFRGWDIYSPEDSE